MLHLLNLTWLVPLCATLAAVVLPKLMLVTGYDFRALRNWYRRHFEPFTVMIEPFSGSIQQTIVDAIEEMDDSNQANLTMSREFSKETLRVETRFKPATRYSHDVRFEGVAIKVTTSTLNAGQTYDMHGREISPHMFLEVRYKHRDLLIRFLHHAQALADRKQSNRLTVFVADGQDASSMHWSREEQPAREMTQLAYSREIQSLADDAATFFAAETREWYHRHGIPYHRGYLLHGPPGTGKSSFVKALATRLRCPIYAVGSVACEDEKAFARLMRYTIGGPKIVLLEDVDCLLAEKSNDKGGKAITMSTLLNELDGICPLDACIFIATTNFLEHLPQAMIRPGRMDRVCLFGLPDWEQSKAIVERMTEDPTITDGILDAIRPFIGSLSHADIQSKVQQSRNLTGNKEK